MTIPEAIAALRAARAHEAKASAADEAADRNLKSSARAQERAHLALCDAIALRERRERELIAAALAEDPQ